MDLRETIPNYRDTSDQELVELFKKGDKEAFGELYGRHHPRLIRYLVIRGASTANAEDIASKGLLQAMEKIHLLKKNEKEGAFAAWMNVICWNLWIDFNKVKRARDTTLDVLAFVSSRDTETDIVAIQSVEGQRITVAIERVLSRLTPFQCEVFRLRYEKGLSMDELAKALGRSVGAIKTGLFRANTAMRANPTLVALMAEVGD